MNKITQNPSTSAVTISNLANLLFSCRLCWRITFGVFTLILVIESVLLIPSAMRFEQVELERLAARTQQTVEPALLLGPGLSGLGPLTRDLATLAGQYGIKGLLVQSTDGAEIARSGQIEMVKTKMTWPLPIVESGRLPIVYELGSNEIAVLWRSAARGEPIVVAVVDASQLASELIGYLIRIGGLVFVIVLVVTGGTMVLVYRMLLKPLLALRTSATAAGNTPKDASSYVLPKLRGDELGDLVDAFNALLIRVTDSMRREADTAQAREKSLARLYAATGLPNRLALTEHLQAFFSDAEVVSQRPTLFLIEFTGRDLLARAAPETFSARLKQFAGSRDLVAQLSPTLFALSRDTPSADGGIRHALSTKAAEQILLLTDTIANDGDASYLQEARIGIVDAADGSIDADEIISRAEFALGDAYADADVQYQYFDRTHAHQARERQLLTRDLTHAFANGDLQMWYQPKVSLRNRGVLVGAEALVRWHHCERGWLSPAEFVPLAEATGQIESLDRYVFAAVCAQIGQWQSQSLDVPAIAINIAARTFARPNLTEELSQMLLGNKISSRLIEIEITESAAIKNVTQAIISLRALRQLGLSTAIDDFGTGYSSLSYLRRFKFDTLKIDRTFVEDIGRDPHAEAICAAIIKLGHAIGTTVVAEGVETDAQANFLSGSGCDVAQGFLFGRPTPANEFASMWLSQSIAHSADLPLRLAKSTG